MINYLIHIEDEINDEYYTQTVYARDYDHANKICKNLIDCLDIGEISDFEVSIIDLDNYD